MGELVRSADMFWQRGKGELQPTVGELEDEYSSLALTLLQAKKFGLLEKKKGEPFLYTPAVEFQLDDVIGGKQSRERSALAQVRFNPDRLADLGVSLELTTDSLDKSDDLDLVRSYSVPPNGVAVELLEDEFGDDVKPHTLESSEIEQALGHIEAVLKDDIQSLLAERVKRGQKIEKVARIAGGAAVGLILITGVVGGLIKTFVIDVNERNEELRQVYDQGDHQLPGEGAPIENLTFTPIPKDEFNAIPTFGGSDKDLDNPRQFNLSSTDSGYCAEVKVPVPKNSELFVSVPASSELLAYHYDTTLTDDGFSVCIIEETPSEGFEGDLKIALQLRPAAS